MFRVFLRDSNSTPSLGRRCRLLDRRKNERLFMAVVCRFAQYMATLIETILMQSIGAASV
ncbi:MAG: hypothetical protein AUG08_14210 [Acidobacteria bacterium 13_1_20CM_2_55_15]|nr:MAG: hypothetical protein AUH28_20615 [Acidobacteria bacterium 13_1_40CM_56_16]OLD70583.1 MAG: hypothetical protein AUI45_04150 [Acidobacteria bacterium 13_1_40CM_2_56_11]OLE86625.1 MAG: hypothetical protein AUG08_14210 [Acidobacteria bacterium 13_1_20CM_2_55_15]PYS18304.1 MAG: hypothetical protein DMG17_06460 [Acidobacteriota bacterium]